MSRTYRMSRIERDHRPGTCLPLCESCLVRLRTGWRPPRWTQRTEARDAREQKRFHLRMPE